MPTFVETIKERLPRRHDKQSKTSQGRPLSRGSTRSPPSTCDGLCHTMLACQPIKAACAYELDDGSLHVSGGIIGVPRRSNQHSVPELPRAVNYAPSKLISISPADPAGHWPWGKLKTPERLKHPPVPHHRCDPIYQSSRSQPGIGWDVQMVKRDHFDGYVGSKQHLHGDGHRPIIRLQHTGL